VRHQFALAVLLAAALLAPSSHAQTGGPVFPTLPADGGADNSANGNPPAERAARDAIPFTDDMIRELARRFKTTQQAKEEGATETAAPANRRVNVSFAPGGATPIIETVKGYPTAVSFFDSTGQPWPIVWDTNSNSAAVANGSGCTVSNAAGGGQNGPINGFHVCTPTRGSNVLEITPMSLRPQGGLVVALEGAPKPIVFMMTAGHGRYDASLSVHLADRGPHARVEIMTRPDIPDTGAPYLTGMLEGVPPADAVPLSVLGVSPEGLRAWRLGRNVYLRTSYTLLSPEWTASEEEAGLTVYAVPATPWVLLSVNGRTVSAELKE
jgi:intracellular multiplication protein IcmK